MICFLYAGLAPSGDGEDIRFYHLTMKNRALSRLFPDDTTLLKHMSAYCFVIVYKKIANTFLLTGSLYFFRKIQLFAHHFFTFFKQRAWQW